MAFEKVKTQEEITIETDELYLNATDITRTKKTATISFLQRKLIIGYNRAARLLEAMESQGIITGFNDKGVRTVVQKDDKTIDMFDGDDNRYLDIPEFLRRNND